MDVNYFAIFLCGVVSLAVGAVWYGPHFFGKMWLKVISATHLDLEARKKMMEGVGKLYFTQFALTLFQVYVLAYLVAAWPGADAIKLGLFLWAGFVMPTIAAGAMWNNDSAKVAWARFSIQAGYQFLMFLIYGYILNFVS